MERNDFEKCCTAIEDGVEIVLENMANHEIGRVLFCTRDQFRVEVEGETQTWRPESCEELSACSEGPQS